MCRVQPNNGINKEYKRRKARTFDILCKLFFIKINVTIMLKKIGDKRILFTII